MRLEILRGKDIPNKFEIREAFGAIASSRTKQLTPPCMLAYLVSWEFYAYRNLSRQSDILKRKNKTLIGIYNNWKTRSVTEDRCKSLAGALASHE